MAKGVKGFQKGNKVGKTFKAGQSGNPNGRPSGTKNRATLLKYWLATEIEFQNPVTKQTEKTSLEDIITLAVIKRAMGGDVKAFREIQDTLYGRITITTDETKRHELGPNATNSFMAMLQKVASIPAPESLDITPSEDVTNKNGN